MASTVDRIIAGVADALGGVARAMTSEAGFHETAATLGWDLDDVPAPFAQVAAPAQALIAIGEQLAAADVPSPADIDLARVAIRDLVTALRALDTADFGAGLDELRQLGREALDHSILEYLFREHRLALHILRMMGIVRVSFARGAGPRGPRIVREILWANVPRVLTDPGGAYREAYGWGTTDFDGRAVLAALQDLLCTMRWPAGLEPLPAHLVDGLATRDQTEGNADVGLTIRFLSRIEPDRELAAGLRILELPATPARLPALAVIPFASASVGTRFAIDDHVDGELVASGDLQGGIALRLAPEDGLTLHTGIYDPATATAGTGTISGAIDVHDPDKLPKVFFETDGGFRFSASTVVGRAGAIVDSASERDLFVEVELKDARVELGSGGDGLVRRAVPPSSGTNAAIAFGVSTKRGIYFRGGSGLSTRIPINRSLGPARLDALRVAAGAKAGGLELRVESEVSLAVGPVTLTLDGLGGVARLVPGDGNLAFADVTVDTLMPSGLGIAIESELVRGGGAIARDEHGYLGGFAVRVGTFVVSATGLVETSADDYSFAAILSATFPRIPLFAGFTLGGIGGAVMLHRALDVDALRARLRTGFSDLLFPEPAAVAATARSLRDLFPAREGRHVVGPAARIGWGEQLRADLALLVELPAPIRIALLGTIEVGLPTLEHRIVDVNIELLGVLDLARKTLAFDATLRESKLAGYDLTGDAALRMGWGDEPHFLLAIGGFHPRFSPPPGFPALRRVALAIGDNPQLRLEAYFAIAASTVQLGAHVDLSYRASGLQIGGHLHFDAIIQVRPLAIEAELSAGVAISYRGHNIASAKLEFLLTGPRPWRAKGTATIGILWWDVSVGFDETWGERAQPALPPPPNVAEIVRAALAAPSAWAGELPPGERSWLVIRDQTTTDTTRVHPLAAVIVRQRAAPLEHPITRFDNAALPSSITITIANVRIGNTTLDPVDVEDTFAPGQFTKLANDEELAAPAFERMPSGVRFAGEAVTTGEVARVPMDHVTFVDDPFAPPERAVLHGVVSADLLAAVRALDAPPPPRPRAITLSEPRYVLASVETLAKAAHEHTTYATLREAMRGASGLQVVPASEAR